MATFTSPEDYKGFYQISGNSFDQTELQLYIDEVEPEILRDLMGCDLYDLFVADLVGNVPQTQRFINIFNAFCIDNPSFHNTQEKSKGIIEMLKGFVYFSYVKESDFANVITGNIKNAFSNSEQARSVEVGFNDRYNRAIVSYKAIQWYMCENTNGDEYPEENSLFKDFISWL